MTTHTVCFHSLIKKKLDFWNSEVDPMKKISKMADFNFFQQGTADVLLLGLEWDMSWSR